MTETRRVVRREPEVFRFVKTILSDPFRVYSERTGEAVRQMSEEDFHATFIDADQFEREQRDKVIKELHEFASQSCANYFRAGFHDTSEIYENVMEFLKSQLGRKPR